MGIKNSVLNIYEIAHLEIMLPLLAQKPALAPFRTRGFVFYKGHFFRRNRFFSRALPAPDFSHGVLADGPEIVVARRAENAAPRGSEALPRIATGSIFKLMDEAEKEDKKADLPKAGVSAFPDAQTNPLGAQNTEQKDE